MNGKMAILSFFVQICHARLGKRGAKWAPDHTNESVLIDVLLLKNHNTSFG